MAIWYDMTYPYSRTVGSPPVVRALALVSLQQVEKEQLQAPLHHSGR